MLALIVMIALIAVVSNQDTTQASPQGVLPVATAASVLTVLPSVQPANYDPAAVAAGQKTFRGVCAACHAVTAMGIEGLGKPLVGSAFFNARTDSQMLDFLHTGRPLSDPLNTTGVVMPPRGGRPSLTDQDLLNVIAYLRSLNTGR
jgi:disulfide bond formation protein DsbB